MYRWVDHTAEVELAIEAADERGVFEDALSALAELLGFGSTPATEERTLAVEAADRPALLATWLEELAFLAESQGFVATRLKRCDLAEERLDAVVSGLVDEPPPLVKAVTYHRLSFEARDERYFASVVLDV